VQSNIESKVPAAPPAPYVLPADLSGLGTVAVQWAGDAAGNWGLRPGVRV